MFPTILFVGFAGVLLYIFCPYSASHLVDWFVNRRFPPPRRSTRLKSDPAKPAAPLPPAAEPGIRLSEMQIAEDAPCRVCGQSRIGDRVTCDKCMSPHHRDCWDWVGGCSTFGCGGSKRRHPDSSTDDGNWVRLD